MSTFDVYAYGVVSASTLYRLAGEYPGANGYAEIAGVDHMAGGEATNSSIVLSRLGLEVRLDGNWLGFDPAGDRTVSLLSRHGIDTSRLSRKSDFRTIEEVVFTAPGSRTIFATYARLQERECWSTPDKSDLDGARCICLDPFMKQASLRVAEWGDQAGIPVVTVDCRHDEPLLAHVSALVVSADYLGWQYAGRDLDQVFGDFLSATDGLVIFTFGEGSIWFGRKGGGRRTRPAVQVEAIDTSGAGDAFRAGVVYGFLQGWDDSDIIEFSASLAALVCMRSPGVLEAPDLPELAAFRRSLGHAV